MTRNSDSMRTLFATAYLLLLMAYAASHFIDDIPAKFLEVRKYFESVFLYVYLCILGVLSISQIARYIRPPRSHPTITQVRADMLAAYTYVTRIVVFALIIGLPLLIVFNFEYAWGLSDTTLVAIPTVILALLVAEQGLYSFHVSRLDASGPEAAALSSLRQVIESLMKSRELKVLPDKRELDVLDRALARLEERTFDQNFAKFATQARMTLHTIRENDSLAIWKKFIERVSADLNSGEGVYVTGGKVGQ